MIAWSPPPPLSLLLERPRPPQNVKRRKKSASRAMLPTMTPTSRVKRMSKFRTCESSWAMTPWTSSRSIRVRRPVVTAIDACFGIAARGEGVHRRVVDEVDPRGREVRGDRQLGDDVEQLRLLLRGDLAGARRRQDERVALEVRDERDDDAERDGPDRRRDPARQRAGQAVTDRQPQGGEDEDESRPRGGTSCACWPRSGRRTSKPCRPPAGRPPRPASGAGRPGPARPRVRRRRTRA